MKLIILILFFITSLYSMKINEPDAIFKANGAVTDIVYKESKLYVATDSSGVDIFDTKTQKLLTTLKIGKITDFMGDIIDSKIYSIDILNDKILIVSQAEKGARRVHIYENNTFKLIDEGLNKLFIAKAKFINENTIIVALLGNEIISYKLQEKKKSYSVQVSQSKFSDFTLNENKSEIIIADESGTLQVYKTADGSFIKEFSGQNLDNVFQVDYKNGIILTAGQDRRAVVYSKNSTYYKKAPFLIYSVGLSPSGKIAAYASDENNNVTLFKTSTQSRLGIYGKNKMTLTKILFIDESSFFVASDDKTVNFYKVKSN